jgi:hypothetical protein
MPLPPDGRGVAIPTERADEKVPEFVYAESREAAQKALDESYLTKYRAIPAENINLTPAQAETVQFALSADVGSSVARVEALALLAGVPGKDSDT